jgi:hypothetical protein
MIAAPLPQFVRDMVSAGPPPAGTGVNIWLFRMARVLHPYRSETEIANVLHASVAGCGRPVTEQEIARAITRSKDAAWQPGELHSMARPSKWPVLNAEQRESVMRDHGTLADLWEASPVSFDDSESHVEYIVDQLFPNNPLLCAGRSNSGFATMPREKWRGSLADLALIVPNPMTAKTGLTQEGKESDHTLNNTGARRFLIIEQDRGTMDDQAGVLLHLAKSAPLALVVFSGSKSLHGWFYCAGQFDEKVRRFMERAVTLGADHATWTRLQFVRMPDGTRDNGNRQTVYFFNPEVII